MDPANPDGPDRPVPRGAAESKDDAARERHADDIDPSDDRGSDLVVIVTVTRSGGIAGIRRSWRAQAAEDEASPWIARIQECPWDAARLGRVQGADRFVWDVDARCGEDERQAELADSDVRGPWRELIDAVREEGAPIPRGRD